MKVKDLKKFKLPEKPGVYFFYKNKDILYIGKATSLRDRVKSYFGKDLIVTRGPIILDMVTQATSIKWQETDSVLEALILEANLIKKYQPKYNTKEKDNKSFNYVCITKEEIPKVLVVRGRNLNYRAEGKFFSGPRTREDEGPDHSKNLSFGSVYGPFPNGSQLKEAMRIVRRIFPYIDEQSSKKNNKEFYKQLGLVPIIGETKQKHKNFYVSALSDYKKNIRNLKLFFEGKKKRIISNLKKEMAAFSKSRDFENAARIRDQIFALNHINDVALIKEDKIFGSPTSEYRVEAYDIAHMSGQNMVGVMTVMEDGLLAKNEYKKFIIRSQKSSNDTGALEEVLSRRFRHIEWGLPNLIVVDGSTAQINVAKRVLNRYQFKIAVVSVVKDDKHKAKAIMGDEILIKKYKKEILLINSEAHRFAIAFHKQKRNKNFLR
ncbi:MAG: UvrB/UvrC motif-containing protein [Candidatus Paceibacterota bacterium]|jgi:excinuclease ABC subunit C